MAVAPEQFETRRLVIRRFTAEDWPDVQKLAVDKEASVGGKYDHAWPTDEQGCRGAAAYFAGSEAYWAVCLKDGGTVIGLLAINGVDEQGAADVGHVFHTAFVADDLDAEALECIIDHAFTREGVQRVLCSNAEEWTVQLAPLHRLGLKAEGRGDGSSFFQRDADGNPITFVGCRMGITKEEWGQRTRIAGAS